LKTHEKADNPGLSEYPNLAADTQLFTDGNKIVFSLTWGKEKRLALTGYFLDSFKSFHTSRNLMILIEKLPIIKATDITNPNSKATIRSKVLILFSPIGPIISTAY
jgi:hypothetical protein